MEIADKCSEETFSITGEDKVEGIDGVEVFKYLRRPLDQSYNYWIEVLWNTRKA